MENVVTQKKFSVIDFYKKNTLVINFTILSILFLANCFFAFFSYIALPIAYIMLLYSDAKKALSHIIFIFPFVWFHLEFGMIMLVVCLITFIIKMLHKKIKKENNKLNISKQTIVFGLLCIIFCLMPVSGIYNIHIIIKSCFIITILALVYFMIKFPEEFKLKYNLCVLAVALLIASLFAYVTPAYNNISNIEIYHINSYIIRFSALFYNPNNLGLVCEIGMCILTFYFATNKCTKRDVFSFLTFLILGVLTFSKAFAIICVAIMGVLFLSAIKHRSKIIWTSIGLSCICALLMLIIQPEILNIYLDRIIVDSGNMGEPTDAVDAFTTGRFDVWMGYVKYLLKHPIALLFGVGLGGRRIIKYSTHNLLISTFYQLGIFGTILFVLSIIFIAKDAKKFTTNKISKAILISFALIAILSCFEDIILYVA